MSVHLLASLSNPLGLVALTAAIPIVVFFLLKRRYRQHEVSSTLLWARLMEDVLARAPFRRPTEWLSLALLVCTVALLGLAAAGLRIGTTRAAGTSFLVVIDRSASMGTIGEDGPRFDEVRDGVRGVLEGMQAGDDVTLIAVGPDDPAVLCHRATDPAIADQIFADVSVTAVEGDLVSALTYAAQQATIFQEEGGRPEVLVFSDFAGDRVALEAVATAGVPVLLLQCGAEEPNAGITHAALTGSSAGARLLVTIAARSGDPTPVARTVELYRDETLIDARDVSLPPGGDERAVVFEVDLAERTAEGGADDGERFTVRLAPTDAFSNDDAAYLGVARAPAPVLLHIGEEDPFLRGLAKTFPGLDVRTSRAEDAASLVSDLLRPVDLVIVTEPIDLPPPPALREFYFGILPPQAGLDLGDRAVHPVVMQWDRNDPMLHGVGLEGLQVVASRAVSGPPGVHELVRTTSGAQWVRLALDDREVFVWASGVRESNLVLIPAFPLLVRNLLGESLTGIRSEVRPISSGLRVAAGGGRFDGEVDLRVSAPDGSDQGGSYLSREEFFWSGPLEPGIYTVIATSASAKGHTRYVGMNLFSKLETTSGVETPEASAFAASRSDPGSVEVAAAGALDVERPVWRSLVVAAIALLLLEAGVWAECWRRRP